jgi:hypothetical protein
MLERHPYGKFIYSIVQCICTLLYQKYSPILPLLLLLLTQGKSFYVQCVLDAWQK